MRATYHRVLPVCCASKVHSPTDISFDSYALGAEGSAPFSNEIQNKVVQIQPIANSADYQLITQRIEQKNLQVRQHNDFDLNTINAESNTLSERQIEEIKELSLKKLAEHAQNNQTNFNNSKTLETSVIATSTTVTSGLSVGYILWLLRGSTLLARQKYSK